MRIGIIIFSKTGHTLALARIVEESLKKTGHQVTLLQLETVVPLKLSVQTADLRSVPGIDAYDAIVFATPVHGGRMSVPINSFLQQCPSLKGKKVACLATHFFPHMWGGDQAIRSMKKECMSKGAEVVGTGSISWFSLSRKRQITELINRLGVAFSPVD